MNKNDLVASVAEQVGEPKSRVAATIDATLDAIAGGLSRGDRVQLTGFGTFEVRDRAPRMARNPRTGEAIAVAASRAPAFKAGKALKDVVNV